MSDSSVQPNFDAEKAFRDAVTSERTIEAKQHTSFGSNWIWYFADGQMVGWISEDGGIWQVFRGSGAKEGQYEYLNGWLTFEQADRYFRDAL